MNVSRRLLRRRVSSRTRPALIIDSRTRCVLRWRDARRLRERRARRRLRGLWLLTLLLAVLTSLHGAQARDVYRCANGDGPIVYADKPCADESRMRVLTLDEAPPSRKPTPAQRDEARRIATWERQSHANLPASLGGSPPKSTRDAAKMRASERPASRASADPCAQARDAREKAYRERGNRMGFDERRRLQDQLNLACANS